MNAMNNNDIEVDLDVDVTVESTARPKVAPDLSPTEDVVAHPGHEAKFGMTQERVSTMSTILIICHQCSHARELQPDDVVAGAWRRLPCSVCGYVRGTDPQMVSSWLPRKKTP